MWKTTDNSGKRVEHRNPKRYANRSSNGRGELLRLPNTAHFVTGEWDAYEAGIRKFILG